MLSVQEHSIEIDSKFYTVYLAYDVIQWRSKLDNWGGTYSYIRVHRP